MSGWDTAAARPKGVVTPADMRTSLASLARAEGIMLEAGAAVVTRPTQQMALTWTAFTAVIRSSRGGWLCPRIGAATQAIAVGHSTYPRIDVIWVRQHDYESDASHPDSEVEVGVATGTATASPSTPAVPTGALPVFTVRVPAGATSGSAIPAENITRCRWTTPVGGVLTAATQTEAAALVASVPASDTNPVHVVVSGVLSVWNGSTWRPVGPRAEFQPVGDIGLVPLTAASGSPLIIKNGTQSGYSTTQFGNGYLPQVTFSAPFPTRCVGVFVQRVFVSSGQYPATQTRAIMPDMISASGFRLVIPGETSPAVHAVNWVAYGF